MNQYLIQIKIVKFFTRVIPSEISEVNYAIFYDFFFELKQTYEIKSNLKLMVSLDCNTSNHPVRFVYVL